MDYRFKSLSILINKIMKSRNLIVVLIILLFVLGLIYFISSTERIRGTSGINTRGQSGIKGFVMTGPICPARRDGDTNCGDRPIKTDVIVKNKKNNAVKNIETLDDGSFSVNLSPGEYAIFADTGGKVSPESKMEYVTVEDGEFTDVAITIIDTGIR